MANHLPKFLALVANAKAQVRCCEVQILTDELASLSSTVIDVREQEEWNEGHLEGALHCCKGVIERDIEKLVPNLAQRILLYCGGGFRSVLAAEQLQRMGYLEVISIEGGFRALKQSGLKIIVPS